MSVTSLLRLEQAGVRQRLLPVDAECHTGELLHIIGPNGAGKSTLLALMAGLIEGCGEVVLADKPLSHWSGRDLALLRAYLPQQHPPVALMPVFQYLWLHQPPLNNIAGIDDVVQMLAERLMLADKLQRSLTQLSGGEWQRVRLAAVLLQVWPSVNTSARLLLLDEPDTSLDIAQRVVLDELLSELCCAGIGVVVSTHDLNHSLHHADRIWLMADGKLVAQGKTEKVMQPETLSPVFGVIFQRHSVDGHHWMITRSA
ncbi:vitamin B12 ABC transporter ATP-binding protein BtuD [Brenneria uluponensis]|uniref:vitamin B12 ABC transporter ATP-binding protein BtuD n=1 Tax=Brenneria uluponensis TaxID=3057057 RepID=UPI0028ED8559|nr:vitamin B12 ABC transporter ATP-binding protein BtuD [Brenneria ulupoensis]